jgi:hypothetical protein
MRRRPSARGRLAGIGLQGREFTSRQDLADKIENLTVVYNRTAKPYRWTYDGRPLKVT